MFVDMALFRHQNAPFTRNNLNIHEPCVRLCVYLEYLCCAQLKWLCYFCSYIYHGGLQIYQIKMDNNQSEQMAETMAANAVVILQQIACVVQTKYYSYRK